MVAGSPINGFQSGKPDPFGFEGGEPGSLGFRADVDALPGLYPPPDATRIIPIRIDFNPNAKNVNVGHFNNMSMAMDASMFPVPLLQGAAEGKPIKTEGMNIVQFDSSEVLDTNILYFLPTSLSSNWPWTAKLQLGYISIYCPT